jgi:transcription-repair coupling factor (superfamily II helicase)
MLDEAVRGMDGMAADDEPEPVRLDVNVDAYVPADYVPYEQAKVDVHRRVAASRDVADLAVLRDELEDRFGPVPEPLENLIALQQARIKFGRAGARMVSFHGEMLAATPLELTPEQAQELGERVPAARYEPGRSQVSFRVPRDAHGRFRIVVAAADALLAVTAPVAEAAAA